MTERETDSAPFWDMVAEEFAMLVIDHLHTPQNRALYDTMLAMYQSGLQTGSFNVDKADKKRLIEAMYAFARLMDIPKLDYFLHWKDLLARALVLVGLHHQQSETNP